MGVSKKKAKLPKEYAVIGSILLLILLTVWGWYLKTNQIEVFKAGDMPKSLQLQTRVLGGLGADTPIRSGSSGDATDTEKSSEPGIGAQTGNNGNEFSGKIDINTAQIDELVSLNGIGEAKAQEIVAYREQNGLFQSIEEILLVKGIGEATFEKIKDHITTGID